MKTAILVFVMCMGGCSLDTNSASQPVEGACTTAPTDIAPCDPQKDPAGCVVRVKVHDLNGYENTDLSMFLDAATAERFNAWCRGGSYGTSRECCINLDGAGMYCTMCNDAYGFFISYYPGLHR